MTKNWSIEAHRKKIAHVEIDFLARDSRGMLHIVEVKSAGAWDVGVVSEKQHLRLSNVAEILSLREPVGLLILVVEEEMVTPIRL